MTNSCFALAPDGKCRVLLVGECEGESCPFYKTKKELEEQLQKLGRLQEGELT